MRSLLRRWLGIKEHDDLVESVRELMCMCEKQNHHIRLMLENEIVHDDPLVLKVDQLNRDLNNMINYVRGILIR